MTHTHYNHVAADRDVNCMLPLDRLRGLCDLESISLFAAQPELRVYQHTWIQDAIGVEDAFGGP